MKLNENGFSSTKIIVSILCSILILVVFAFCFITFSAHARANAMDSWSRAEALSVSDALEKLAQQYPEGVITEVPTAAQISTAGNIMSQYSEDPDAAPVDKWSTLVVFTDQGYIVTTVSSVGKVTRANPNIIPNAQNKNIPLGYPNSPAGFYAQSSSTFAKTGSYAGPPGYVVLGF